MGCIKEDWKNNYTYLYKKVGGFLTFEAPADLSSISVSPASVSMMSTPFSALGDRIAALGLFATVNPARAPEPRARRKRR